MLIPLTIGYSETLAVGLPFSEKRMIEVTVLPDESRDAPFAAAQVIPAGTDWWRNFVADQLRELVRRVASIGFDYVSVQCGRSAPSPRALATSSDPRDFHRLFIAARPEPGRELEAAAAAAPGWHAERMAPNGVFITRRAAIGRDSEPERHLLGQLRQVLARRFGLAT